MAEYLTWNGLEIVPDGSGFVKEAARRMTRAAAIPVEFAFVTGFGVKTIGVGNGLATAGQIIFASDGEGVTRTYYATKAAAYAGIAAVEAAVAANPVGTLEYATPDVTRSVSGCWLLLPEAPGVVKRESSMGDWAVDWFLQFVRTQG